MLFIWDRAAVGHRETLSCSGPSGFPYLVQMLAPHTQIWSWDERATAFLAHSFQPGSHTRPPVKPFSTPFEARVPLQELWLLCTGLALGSHRDPHKTSQPQEKGHKTGLGSQEPFSISGSCFQSYPVQWLKTFYGHVHLLK